MILGHMIFDSSVNAYVVNDYVIKPGDLIYVHFTSPRGKLTVIPTQMILDYRHQWILPGVPKINYEDLLVRIDWR